MVTTTTFQAIRNNAYAKLKALTPTVRADVLFDRQPREYVEPLRAFAIRVGPGALRRVEMRASGEEDPGVMPPDAKEVRVTATLTVAYPNAPGLYGTGSLDTDASLTTIEDVIASDARQISDALFSSANYLAGQNTAFVTIQETDRDNPLMYFQEFALEIHFYKAQTV